MTPNDDRTPTTVRLTLTIGGSSLPWNVRLRAALKLLLRRHALLCTLVEFPDDAPLDSPGVTADEERSDRVD